MRTATDLLSQYAAYHRDRRNIVSHLVGVPMIVFAIGCRCWRGCRPPGRAAVRSRRPGCCSRCPRRGT